MKFECIIVGVYDFVSKNGKPMRQIHLTSDVDKKGLVGKSTFVVWQFQDGDYFNMSPNDLVGHTCRVLNVGGNYAIAGVTGIDF